LYIQWLRELVTGLARARQRLVLPPFTAVAPWLIVTRPGNEPALAPVTVRVNHTRVADLHPQQSVPGGGTASAPLRSGWIDRWSRQRRGFCVAKPVYFGAADFWRRDALMSSSLQAPGSPVCNHEIAMSRSQ
jgi:hypothetical protein